MFIIIFRVYSELATAAAGDRAVLLPATFQTKTELPRHHAHQEEREPRDRVHRGRCKADPKAGAKDKKEGEPYNRQAEL